jgi:serine/threonine-protein kinase SRPK3
MPKLKDILKQQKQQRKRKDEDEDEETESESDNSSITLSDDDRYITDYTTDSEEDYAEDEETHVCYCLGGYHRVTIGDVCTGTSGSIKKKYKIEKKLGFGRYSTVWLASIFVNDETPATEFVALKIQKSAYTYLKAAKKEIHIASIINDKKQEMKREKGESDEVHVIEMIDNFKIQGSHGTHYVLVYKLMGRNVETLLDLRDYEGFDIPHVKHMARQMLQGLAFINDECGIIHGDLKPENILSTTDQVPDMDSIRYEYVLKRIDDFKEKIRKAHNSKRKQEYRKRIVTLEEESTKLGQVCLQKQIEKEEGEEKKVEGEEKYCDVKLADFGNALDKVEPKNWTFYSYHYKAPELCVKGKYNTNVDIWAAGALFFEFLTGDYLFHRKTLRYKKEDESKNGSNSDDESSDDDSDSSSNATEHEEDSVEESKALLKIHYQILGPLAQSIILDGKDSKEIFRRSGDFRKNKVPLERTSIFTLLTEKYGFDDKNSKEIEEFLLTMFETDATKRPSAKEMLKHKWLLQ